MKAADIRKLVEWLGVDGAVAGLERSDCTNAELMVIAREAGHLVDKKTARRQIIIELVMSGEKRIDKTHEYLLNMSSEELQRYFSERMASTKEIMELLTELDIAPTGKIRGKLVDYAAREIGELGLFQRVAKGDSTKKLI